MNHCHVTVGGMPQAGQYDSATAAEAAASRELADAAREKRRQGYQVEVLDLPFGGWLLTWADGFVHGTSAFHATGCMADHSADAVPNELMGVRVEVWPVGATEEGLWLLSGGDAWRTSPIRAVPGARASVITLLRSHGLREADLALVHGTSDRDEDGHLIVTEIAIVACPDVLHHWPFAVPIPLELGGEVGKPYDHAACEAPTPRYVDVLLHALRHVADLSRKDSTAEAALPPLVRQHLDAMAPELFRRYLRDPEHQAA